MKADKPKIELPDCIAEWNLEPELTLPPPRTVALRDRNVTGMALAFLIPWILALAAALGFWFGGFSGSVLWVTGTLFMIAVVGLAQWWTYRASKSLVERGTATRGVVIKFEWVAGFEQPDFQRFMVAYDTTEGRRLSLSVYDATLVRGDTVTILYLPEAPKRAKAYKECVHRAVLPTPDPR